MQEDEKVLAVGIVEAARRLGISARTVATLIATGELASRKIGRRRIIPVQALQSFLRNEANSDSAKSQLYTDEN
jgi:excisionase family DNA binding protein